MATLLSTPDELGFAYNQIPYSFQISASNVLVVEVWIESSFGAGDFKRVSWQMKDPDATGLVWYDAATILKHLVQHEAPQIGQATHTEQTCKRYFLQYSETPRPNYANNLVFDNAEIMYALAGGVEFNDFPQRSRPAPNASSLLTAAPENREIYVDAEHFVTYFPVADESLDLYFSVTNDRGTVTNFSRNFGSGSKYCPVHLPIGAETSGFGTFQSAKVTFPNGESLRLRPFNPPCQDVEVVYYTNLYGGIDNLFCEGVSSVSAKAQRRTFQHFTPVNYSRNFRQIRTYNHERQQRGRLRTGFKMKNEYRSYIHFLDTPQSWILRSGDLLPIHPRTEVLPSEPPRTELFSAEFDYDFSQISFGRS